MGLVKKIKSGFFCIFVAGFNLFCMAKKDERDSLCILSISLVKNRYGGPADHHGILMIWKIAQIFKYSAQAHTFIIQSHFCPGHFTRLQIRNK